MEVERDPEVSQDDLPNMRGEDVPQVLTVANGGTHENNEASSSSTSSLPLANLSATERALQNPLILLNLFQLCPVSIVANCRLVSKQWYDESLTTWRSAFPLTLGMKERDIFFVHRSQYYSFDRHVPPNTFTPLKEFLEFCDKPENHCRSKPHRNIRMVGCQFSLNPVEFDRFWNEIGRNLTTLTLSHCKFASVVEFRQIIYKRCPVLQKLEIYYGEFIVQNVSDMGEESELEYREPVYGENKHLKALSIKNRGRIGFPLSWMEIFSHFSSLTSFELTKTRGPEPELETLIKVIKEIRKTGPRKLPFKRFQLHPRPTISRDLESHRKFAMANELKLPLVDCPIEVHPELDQRFLENTLGYLAPFVNSIRIFPEQGDNQADPEGEALFQSVTGAVVNTSIEELANLKMVRLTTLRLDYIVSSNDLRHLMKWMPNMMDLEMVLNNEQFGMVCQNWKGLKWITVLGKELLTEVGIRPHIANGNLEYLKSFQLDVNLTPECVFHLFLHLPNLHELTYYDRLVNATVEREELDIATYQRAIQDNVLEQWITNHGQILRE